MALFLIGCNRRTAALPEAAPPAIEAMETVLIDEHTIPEEPETRPAYGNSAGEHSPVREVTPHELRNVMPNSWHKLTALTEAERQVFMLGNTIAISEAKRILRNTFFAESSFKHFFIFKQQVGTDTFYRVIVTNNSNPDFLAPNIRFFQFLIHQNLVISRGTYNFLLSGRDDLFVYFVSIDIIPGRENAKGILVTQLAGIRDIENPNEWCASAFRNGQLFGFNSSRFYLMEEALRMAAGESFSPIEIDASDSLIDPDVPLRYSLQNAFDGNPATAFIMNLQPGRIPFVR